MKLLFRSTRRATKAPLMRDIAPQSKDTTLNLKKKTPIVHVDFKRAYRAVRTRNFFIGTCCILAILILSSLSTGHASVATFHPTSCLGDWEQVKNAEGQPSLSDDAVHDDFSLENSARTQVSGSTIYCGGFQGEKPESSTPTTFRLSLSWLVEDVGIEKEDTQPFDIPGDGAIVIPAPSQEDISPTEPAEDIEVVPDVVPEEQSPVQAFFRNFFTTFAQDVDEMNTEQVPTELVSEEITVPEFPEEASDAFVEVSYTLDSTTWHSLGKINRSEWNRATFDIPLSDWDNLDNLQISLKTLPTFDQSPTIYLDAMDVDVEYSVQDLLAPPTIKIDEPLTQGKSDFNSTEAITFTITKPNLNIEEIKGLVEEGKAEVIKDTQGILGDKVEDPKISVPAKESLETIQNIVDETKTILDVPPVNPSGDEISFLKKIFSPQIAVAQSTSIDAKILDNNGDPTDIVANVVTKIVDGVDVDHIEIQKPSREFRPGRYTLVVTFTTPQAIIVSQQDFTWGVLVINTNKSVFRAGDDIYIQMGVLNDKGHTICDSDLDLTITSPSGATTRLTTDDHSIVSAKECGPNNVISVPDYYSHFDQTNESGTYTMELTAHTDNGEKTITDSFVVESSPAFSVERVGPSRIYPVASYPMTITIVPTQDWSGTIEERVPVSFDIAEPTESASLYSVREDGEVKIISWDVQLHVGQEAVLTYSFNAPDISPEFYLLGKLQLGDAFEESRNWQIASDAACNATGSGTWSATANFLNCTGAASGGAGTGLRPGVNDDLTINSGVAITGNTTVTIKTLTFAASTAATSLTINDGVTFTVTGTSAIPAPGAGGTNTLTVGGGTSGIFSTAGLTITGSTTAGRNSLLSLSTGGTFTTTSGLTFAGTAAQAQFTNSNAATINLTGTFGTGGTISIASGTTLVSTGTAAINRATTFGNLNVTSGTLSLGGVALTFAGTTSVTGSLVSTSATGLKTFTGAVTVNSGGSFDLSSFATTTSFGGGVTASSGATTFNSGTGTVVFTTSQSLAGAVAMSFGGTATINDGVTLTNSNTGTVTFGALTIASPATGSNVLSLSNSSTTSVTGAITYTANAAANTQTITMNGNANISAGSLVINRPTSTGQSNITCAASATGTLSTSGVATISGASTAAGTVNVLMNTCNFSAGGLLTIAGGTSGGDITFTTTTGVLTAGAGLTFSGTAARDKFNVGSGAFNLSGTMAGAATLTVDSSNTVTTTGTAAVNATYTFANFTVSTGTTTFSGTAQVQTVNGSLTVSSGATLSLAISLPVFVGPTSVSGSILATSNQTKTFTGAITVNSGGTFDLSGAATATRFDGGVTVNSGALAFNSGTGAVTFGASQTLSGSMPMSFGGTVTISDGATVINSNTATVTFGALTIASPTAVASNGLSLSNNSTTSVTNAVTYTANAAANTQTITMNGNANISAGNLVINRPTSTGQSNITCAASATGTLSTSGAATINGASTATATVNVLMNTCNFSVGSLLTINGGTTGGDITLTTTTGILSVGTGITFSGTTARNKLNVGTGDFNFSGTFDNGATVSINSGNTMIVTGTSAINGAYTFGNLSVPSGTLSLGGIAIIFAGTSSISGSLASTSVIGLKTFTGAVTVNSGGIFDLSAFATPTSFAGGITMNGTTFNSSTGTTAFTASQNLAGSSNMTFGGAVTISDTQTLTNNNTGTVTFSSNLLGGGSSANFATGLNSTSKFAGTVMATGTLTPTTSAHTIEYSGGTQTVKTTTTNPYYNLTVSAAGVKSLSATTTATGTTTISAGTLDTTAANSYAFSTGNMTIGASGTFLPNNSTVTITGSWSNSGTFTASGSTVLMNGGTTASVSGTTTFNNLTITHTAAKEINFQTSGSPIFHVTGLFTVTGHSGNLIKLYSDSAGTQWKFHPTGTASVDYVDVKDGGCESGAIFLNPGHFTNSGNNGTCWVAASLTFTISDASIGFGALSPSAATYATGNTNGSSSEVEAHTIAISSSAPSGYSLTVQGATLTNGGYTIAAIGGINTSSIPGSNQFGLRMSASGGIGAVSAPYSDAGFAYDASASTPSTVATAATGDGVTTTYSARYMCNIATTAAPGQYSTNLTYVVTGNF